MKLGFSLGYSGAQMKLPVKMVQLAKNWASIQCTNKAVRGGIINMIESLSSFSVDADVEELEDDMEVKQIEDKKDE